MENQLLKHSVDMDNLETDDEARKKMAIDIGKRMVHDRKAAGLSTRKIAKELGYSPTHYNRLERGERFFHDVDKVIKFCEICNVNLEDYLKLYWPDLPQNESLIRRVFPSISSNEQENAIIAMANIITSNRLTEEELNQMISTAKAFALYCSFQKQ